MRKLFVFFFLLSFFYSANTYGQKVELSDVWVEQNVMKDGKQGMTVHCDVHISGMKGRKFKGVAFFYNANKNKLMGGKGSYSTKSGHVCAHSFGTPRYDKSHYSDFSIFIPYSSFPYASGNHKYYVIVDYYDVNKGEYITNNTKYVAFNINRQRKQQTTDNTYQVDNLKSKTIVEKKVCLSCGGDGVCRICMGQGGRYDRRNYLWLKCTSCLGSIKCPTCNGTGYTTLTMVINPDGSGYGYDNNGHVVATEGGGGGTFNPTPKPVIEHDRTPLYRDCKYCTGTGRCSRCNGKGTSFVTGEFGNQLCPRCNGSGKCDICRGRGKL